MSTDIRESLRRQGFIRPPVTEADHAEESFTTEVDGRQLLVTRTLALYDGMSMTEIMAEEGYLHLRGRFVGADRPNRNKAMWTAGDLEMGLPTVAHGPLNWLHEEKRIIGTITNATLVGEDGREKSAEAVDDIHIEAEAVVWKWLWREEAAVIEQASQMGRMWYSMECISEKVECGECGESFDYIETMPSRMRASESKVCGHIRERSSTRRFINPMFQGGAVIIPPVRPGWGDADLRVAERATEMAESTWDAGVHPDLTPDLWESLMGELLLAHTRGG